MSPPLVHLLVRSTDGRALAQFTLPTELIGHQNMFGPVPVLPPGSTTLFPTSLPRDSVTVVDLEAGRYIDHPLVAFDGTRYLPVEVSAADEKGIAFVLAREADPAGEDFRRAVFHVGVEGAQIIEGRDAADFYNDSNRGHLDPGYILSPDERYALQPASLLPRPTHPPTHPEDWVSCEVHDLEGCEPLFRVLSGVLHPAGNRGGHRWLADGSGFVVMAADPLVPTDTDAEWREQRRNYIVGLDGTIEHLLELPSALRKQHLVNSIAEPSPTDPDLFALGQATVLNRRLGAYLGPANPPIAEHFDPWVREPGKVFFAFPRRTSFGTPIGTILPPRVEYPPFREHVDLVVAGVATCLDLREAPDSEAGVLACLPNGTPLRAVGAPDGTPGAPPPAPAGFTFWSAEPEGPDRQYFVHVRTGTGLEGWVAIQYLEWAP